MVQETPSPVTKLQSGHAASMLQQLIAEAEHKSVVFSDDLSVQMKEQHLQGLAACQEDDVVHKNWLSNNFLIIDLYFILYVPFSFNTYCIVRSWPDSLVVY